MLLEKERIGWRGLAVQVVKASIWNGGTGRAKLFVGKATLDSWLEDTGVAEMSFEDISKSNVPVYSRGSLLSVMWHWMKGESGKEWIHGYVSLKPLCCPRETITTLLTGYTAIQNGFGFKKMRSGERTPFAVTPKHATYRMTVCGQRLRKILPAP